MTRLLIFLSILIFMMGCTDSKTTSVDQVNSPEVPTIASLSASIDQFGGTGEEYFQRAQLYLKDREMQNAADDAVMALKRDSANIEYLHLLSDIQINGYQSRQGLETLMQAVRLDPNNRKTLLKLLETQILLRQYLPAVGTSQRLLQMDPQDHQAFFLRGILFKEQGLDSLAVVNLQRTVDLDASMTGAFVMLGDLHEKKSDPIALGYYKNAVNSDPSNINALHALAFYYQNHGQITEAITTYEDIIQVNPEYQAAYVNKGILELSQDSLVEAKKSLERGFNLDSSFAMSSYYLGELALKEQDNKMAKVHLMRALAIDPEYTAAQKLLNTIK